MQQTRRQLGLIAATAAVIGESIGSGIFLTLASTARSMGSPLLTLALWLGMAAMTLAGALCYAELSVRFPQSGGEVVYLEQGYGERVAFLYGWMSSLVMLPGVAAAMAFGAAAYLGVVFSAGAAVLRFLPALLLLGFCIVNLLGTALSGRLMSAMTWLKVLLLSGLVVWTLASGKAHAANLHPFAARDALAGSMLAGIAGAVVAAFFSTGGWWDASKLAGEVREPRRNMPRAFVTGGVAVVLSLYLLLAFCVLAVTPLRSVLPGPDGVAQFSFALFGHAGARAFAAGVSVCILSALAAISLTAPRVTYAMASAGTFFPSFGKLQGRWQTPRNSILLQTALALLVLGLGAFGRMLSYISFMAVVSLAVTASVLFRIEPRPRAWWCPAAPALFIAACAAIALLILINDPLPALLGSGIVACGYPAGAWFGRKKGTAPELA